jgi:Arc/MetJ-type ribon-helix-helix transcriptional regulator
VKLSVSLDDADVEFIDDFATRHAIGSRSGVVQRALAVLRAMDLGDEYLAAWDEWVEAGEADAWRDTVADGTQGRSA